MATMTKMEMEIDDALSTLMAREAYQNRLKELKAAYPLIPKDAEFNPGPGRLRLVETLLKRVERAIGKAKVTFFELRAEPGTDVEAWVDTASELAEGRRAALLSALKNFTRTATATCLLCEKPTETPNHSFFSTHGFCRDHEMIGKQGIRFYDDDLSPLAEMIEEAEHTAKKTAGGGLDIPGIGELQEEELEDDYGLPTQNTPNVEMYPAGQAEKLDKYAKSRGDRDARQRFQALADQLKKRENWRSLALLPVDWQERLDDVEKSFPNFSGFLDFLRYQFILSEKGDNVIKISPVVLNGAPGIGKTEVMHRLCHALGLPLPTYFDFATMQNSARLVGTDSHWANAAEGELFRALALGEVANPIAFIDEVEKATGEGKYNPVSALLGLLEPTSASRFQDLSLRDFQIDASHVNWMAASNQSEILDDPVKSRFTILQIPSPSLIQMRRIHRAIYSELVSAEPWGSLFHELPEGTLDALVGTSPREAKRLLRTGAGSALLAGRNEIRPEDVSQFKPKRKMAANFVCEEAT